MRRPGRRRHNFRNTDAEPLVLYTIYSPPEHATDSSYTTKEVADAAERAGQDNAPAA